MKKILVTGDTGFVGQTLVRYLRKSGFEVVGVSRAPAKDYRSINIDLSQLSTSKEDKLKLQGELAGCFAVVHLASRVHVLKETALDPSGEYFKLNVEATEELAKIAAAAGVNRFINLSSIKASGAKSEPGRVFTTVLESAPVEAYGKSKLEAEQRLLKLVTPDFAVVALRPPLVYGPGVKANFKSLIALTRKLPLLPFGMFRNRRTLIFVENLADAVLAVLKTPTPKSGSYLVSDSQTVSTAELVSLIAKSFNKKLALLPVPVSLFRFLKFATLGRFKIDPLIENLEVDNSEFRNQFGWEPKYSLEEGLLKSAKEIIEVEKKSLRILVLSLYFWPENFRINDLVSSFVNRGHQVEVVTGIPNYPEGKFYPGYGLFSRAPEAPPKGLSEAKIHRLWIVSRGKFKSVRLAVNYFSFVVVASFYLLFCMRKRFDFCIVFANSPLLQAIPAVLLRKVRGVPLVIWVQDLWPETLSAVGVVKSNKIIGLVGAIVRWIYSNSSLLLLQSNAFKEKVIQWGARPEQLRYLPNWADEVSGELKGNLSELPDGFRIVFAGSLGKAQGLSSVIEAAQLTRSEPAIKWLIIGDGSERPALEAEVNRLSLGETVKFLGRKPASQMPFYFANAGALLVSLSDDPIFSLVIPSKIQAYLTAGKPLLGALNGEGARLINDERVGIAGRALDSSTLAANALALRAKSEHETKEMGDRALRLYKKEFDREQLIDQLLTWVKELQR